MVNIETYAGDEGYSIGAFLFVMKRMRQFVFKITEVKENNK
ncbi:hypothetical protein [Halobacillus yeomjeoni]|nr:hypothetical protein [Halobacillus yeomjeoni]